jgi:hypothetical protein
MGILFERTLTEKGQDMPRVRLLLFLCLVGGFSYGSALSPTACAQSRQPLTHVTAVQCTIQPQPPLLVVTAQGEIPPKGYQEPQLSRRHSTQPPADGMQEYDFTAITPDGVEKKISKKPEATDKWADYTHDAPWLKGVRIYGVAEGIKEALLQSCGRGQ